MPDPLLAELERGRTGEMRDIVATIQAEQDEVIRAPLAECLIVQGGPGTGKTAVGLHRAAFLLYEHRDRLERERLLVVGPNSLFLRYIAQVLPSLGETAVAQTTLPGLLESRFRVRATESHEVATLKGDARMAVVVGRAARAGLATVAEEVAITVFGVTLRLPAAEVQQILEGVHARDLSLKAGRDQLRGRLARLALDRYTELRPSTDEQDLARALRSGKELTGAVTKLWPVPSAAVLVRRLLGSRKLLASVAGGLLTGEEQASLFRRGTGTPTEQPWTRADLSLLDEAEFVISGAPRPFGHVVVDEAQDHSAMELRVLGRRSPDRSMTILGDLAQATASGAQSSWSAALVALDAPHGRVAELELGYRVPAPVLELANRLLPVAAPGVLPSRSVRATGTTPTIQRVPSVDEVPASVVAVTAGERDAERSVGIVAPESMLDAIADALRDAGDRVRGRSVSRRPERCRHGRPT